MAEPVFGLEPRYVKPLAGDATNSARMIAPEEDGVPVLIGLFRYEAGYVHPKQVGPFDYEKTIMVNSGRLRFTLDNGKVGEVGPGQVFHLPAGRWYWIEVVETGVAWTHHSATPGGPIPRDEARPADK